MPATKRRKPLNSYVLGVDGCRAGWVVARLNLSDGTMCAEMAYDFGTLLAGAGAAAAMIIVDMPIGLAEDGPRACERAARLKLSPKRHASVFASPRRPMLDFDGYAAANAWGKARGAGLSKQAWMITPKIREIDEAITPSAQVRIGEGHPEVAFARLNDGTPCAHPKRKPAGAAERKALLTRAGVSNVDALVVGLRATHGALVGRDDVYDACALALTAKARLEGEAWRLSDDARDARGLVMEIWG